MTCRIYLNGKLIVFPGSLLDTVERKHRQGRLNRMMREGVEFDSLMQWIPFHFGQYVASLGADAVERMNFSAVRTNLDNQNLTHSYGRWWMLDLGAVIYRVHDGSNPPRKPNAP